MAKAKSSWVGIVIILVIVFLIFGGGTFLKGYIIGGATHTCSSGTNWSDSANACVANTPSGSWEVAISSATYSDAGVTVIVASGGTSVSYTGSAADLGDNTATAGDAYANVTFRVINRNTGTSVLWATSAQCGSYPTIDGGAGYVYPLIAQSTSDPTIRHVVWTSSQSSPAGSQVSAVFSESILTASSDNFVAHIDILDAALATGATNGVTYTAHVIVAGFDFSINFQRTS